MPNILIMGFGKKAESKRSQIEKILKSLDHSDDSVTTIINSNAKFCGIKKEAPYIIVRDNVAKVAKEIAEEINKKLQNDVEYEVIKGFLEGK